MPCSRQLNSRVAARLHGGSRARSWWLGELSQLTLVEPPQPWRSRAATRERAAALQYFGTGGTPAGCQGQGGVRRGLSSRACSSGWRVGDTRPARSQPADWPSRAVSARSPPPQRRGWSQNRARQFPAARAGEACTRRPEPTRSARRRPGGAGARPGRAVGAPACPARPRERQECDNRAPAPRSTPCSAPRALAPPLRAEPGSARGWDPITLHGRPSR